MGGEEGIPPVEDVFVDSLANSNSDGLCDIVARIDVPASGPILVDDTGYGTSDCVWPSWKILSRKRKIARPSWYDVDEEHRNELSWARRRTRQKSPRHEDWESAETVDPSDPTNGRRMTPSRGAKDKIFTYAEEDDVVVYAVEEEINLTEDDDEGYRQKRGACVGKTAATMSMRESLVYVQSSPAKEPVEKDGSASRLIVNVEAEQPPRAADTVTMKSTTKDTYTLQFPAPWNGLGLTLFHDNEFTRFKSLDRPCESDTQQRPMIGDMIFSVDGSPVTGMSFNAIIRLLAENGGQRPCTIKFKRVSDDRFSPREEPVTMTAVPSQKYDYVLDIPPHPDGDGLEIIRQEDDTACFGRSARPIESDGLEPPQWGDRVECINGKDVRDLEYAQIYELLFTANAGKTPTWIGFKRRSNLQGAENRIGKDPMRFATSKQISNDEYELRLPVNDSVKSLGIRIRNHKSHVCLEALHMDLHTSSQVTPEDGDVLASVDGADTRGLGYAQIVELLSSHGGKPTRVLRLKKKTDIPQDPSSASHCGNIVGQVPVLLPGWNTIGQLSESPHCTRLLNGVHVCSSHATSFFDFDIAVQLTSHGLGMMLFQFGGKPHLERFHDFASLRYIHNIVPEGGEEVIAIDNEYVNGLPYDQVISSLKNHGGKGERVLRLRRYERTLPKPASL